MAELTAINEANEMGFGGLVVPCTSGNGIKCDLTAPAFGYRDIIGQIIPKSTGTGTPELVALNGTKVKKYQFAVGDKIENISYHIPHDYVPNSQLFIHVHWAHKGTAISGTLAGNIYATYSKGYTQAGQVFNAEKTLPFSVSAPNIATIPQRAHNIHEIELSNVGGDATHLDTGLIETDGLIEVAFDITTIPTITGGTGFNRPFILTVDVHYQSTNMATKGRNLPFYGA